MVEDILLQNANIVVQAPNVTIRRVKMQGGWINNFQGPTCANGLTIEDTTIEPPPGQSNSAEAEGVVSYGGYTARRVKIWNRSEGFRVSGMPDCGEVRIENSFEKIVIPARALCSARGRRSGLLRLPCLDRQQHHRLPGGGLRHRSILRARQPGQHQRHG